ncbi:MAG: apolipoprotein N-acyltransferase [Alistipes sp.]
MFRKLAAVIISVMLLSTGWLGLTGLPLLAAFLPLLWISHSYDASRRSWWCVFGWAALTFVLWNAVTIWWIWNATKVGPFAAILASTTLNMIAFMLFHTVSKKAHKALAYTMLVAAWIATEYWYTVGEFSWPWLVLGNGFSHDIRLVQWYEYTGVFGGSLWVLLCNITLFEAILSRRVAKLGVAVGVIVLPMILSAVMYVRFVEPTQTTKVSIIQPNIDCYDKFAAGTSLDQEENLYALAAQAPADVNFIVMPETAIPGYYWESSLAVAPPVLRFQSLLQQKYPQAMLVTGANTLKYYPAGAQTTTARREENYYKDIFNTSLGLTAQGEITLHHKGRLVIGAEKTPLPWLFKALDFLVIDLGGTLGQLGVGKTGTAFDNNGTKVGGAICYEGLYGDFYGDFVRRGASAMFIISNDGWWGDTPGYKHLFTISRLRAIEHRRAIARSANTGRSGFINARGDIGQTLDWQQRGILTDNVSLSDTETVYTRYGDYIGRIAEYLMLLCVLYYVAYRVKKKNHLVD